MPAPLVSVVIPSYDHAAYVTVAVESVAGQTYRPLELVVVDDGSHDDSPALLRRLLDGLDLERAELIEQPNRGAHAAIMRGIEASRGEIVGILNSDDFYHPRRLERLVPFLAAGEARLAFSGVTFVDAEGRSLPSGNDWDTWYRAGIESATTSATLGFAILAHNFSVSSGNFLFTRELYERLGGFSAHRFCHDWDFLVRSFHHAEPRFVPQPLLNYRIHDTNTTETVRDRLREEAIDALRRYVALVSSESSPNLLAPCPANWPAYFETFARRCPLAFAPEDTLWELWQELAAAQSR